MRLYACPDSILIAGEATGVDFSVLIMNVRDIKELNEVNDRHFVQSLYFSHQI